jgi:class I fructose-bisphosphate aldolase
MSVPQSELPAPIDRIKERPTLEDYRRLGRGVQEKLYRMFWAHERSGLGLFLPFDQEWEHGPAYALGDRKNKIGYPEKVLELANKGKFSGVVLHIGQAEKYGKDLNADVPLIIKLDGHHLIGEADQPTHASFCSLDRAMRAGATAVGLTYYLGSTNDSRDVSRISQVIERSHDYGVPVFVWSYPRGPTVNKSQGDSLYWVHHAVRSAEDLGADVIKTKPPAIVAEKNINSYKEWLGKVKKKVPAAGNYMNYEPLALGDKLDKKQHIERYKIAIDSAGKTFVIFSGGPKTEGGDKKELVYQTEIITEAGGEGGIYGRKLWGVPVDEGLDLMDAVHGVLSKPEYRREFRL